MTRDNLTAEVKVSIGTSCLTRDLVWCECGRGLSLTGKWKYCPNCGHPIDQQSYLLATQLATVNAARLYRDAEATEELIASRALSKKLAEALAKLNKHTPQIDNGYCAVCRCSKRESVFIGKNSTIAKPGPCEDDRCLSHVIDAALAEYEKDGRK